MKPPAFQFYADDFLAGVADMTQAEVGAYILLLCNQWNSGAIPTDKTRLGLIAKGEVSDHVVSKFPNGRNNRLERVRRDQKEHRKLRASAGKAGANKRWQGHSNAMPLPMANGMAKDSSPSPSPTPNNILLIADAPSEPKISFDEVWALYPRKVGRRKAETIIKTLISKNPPAFGRELLEKVKAYAEAVRRWPAGQEQFIPHPSTWFNRGSYDDDPATWVRTNTNGRPTQEPVRHIEWGH